MSQAGLLQVSFDFADPTLPDLEGFQVVEGQNV